MPKYKVGDVAALFPKPKEPTTEAGKKLESLFKQFHARKSAFQGSSNQNGVSQIDSIKSESIKTEIENGKISKKNKKRKFTDTEASQSFIEEQSAKKFKQEEPEKAKNSVLIKKKDKFSTEQGFPRNKKLSKSSKNKFEFDGGETKHSNDFKSFPPFSKGSSPKKTKKNEKLDDVQDSILSTEVSKFLSEQGFSKHKKFEFGKNTHDSGEEKNVSPVKREFDQNLKSKNKKQKAIFIKKSIKTELDSSSPNMESKDSKNSSERETVSKTEVKHFNKKSKKNLNKSNEIGNKQSSISPKVSLNHVSENKDSEKQNEVNEVESCKDNSPSKHVGDFIRNKNFKKKVISSPNTFVQKSEQQETYGKELDFIKIPGLKSEVSGDDLSRTLFVGNLPLDTSKKALLKLFTPFGEIERIRFRGKETDKGKIFSENGSKSLDSKNYAADSIPGYIVFKTKESATFALSLSGSLFKGHHITVDLAVPSGTHKLYDDKRSIFIGNLPFGCKDDSIWEAFSECGRIESVRIVRDKETGIGKGFGFVQFSTVQAKEKALTLKDLEIEGRPIRVKEVSAHKAVQTKPENTPVVKRRNTFKSHAIRIKKKNKDSTSRKSLPKIMKKLKKMHEKKKISSILLKSMKK